MIIPQQLDKAIDFHPKIKIFTASYKS